MNRRDIGTDDPRVRVRPGKGSRPRTKNRPSHTDAVPAFVTEVDRGRFTAVTKSGTTVQAVKARSLGRKGVLVGDRVGLEGDVSGRRDTLARTVTVEERRTVLRRSWDESDTGSKEKLIVANATQMLIVTAGANPAPKRGMIDRAMAAAVTAGVKPVLVVTKTDLDPAHQLVEDYRRIGMPVYTTALPHTPSPDPQADLGGGEVPDKRGSNTTPATDLETIKTVLEGEITVLLGHSGVGKSTLINALVPGAQRVTGHVNAVTGKGRHTSSSALALPLGHGWVIDTPGVRSFGLAQLDQDQLLEGFPELAQAAQDCPRGCTHMADSPDCCLDAREELRQRTISFRNLVSQILPAY